MFHTRNVKPQPLAAWTDYTPPGPWADGTVVTRNLDGVGFTYSASLNALTVIPNESFSVKNANNFIIQNLPAPTVGGDAANKTYVDSHSGGGGGTPGGTTGQIQYNNASAFGGFTMSGDATVNTSTGAMTLGTVNSTVGTFQGLTINAKGLVTAGANMGYAPLASPTFSGTPVAPTPTAGTNTTQLATTQFVGTAISNAAVPAPSSATPGMDGAGSAGTATSYSRGDHIHPSDTTKANLASPTFTGTPAAPNPVSTDNSTTLATTQFVKAQGYIIANQNIVLSGDIAGSGATAITTTLATVNSNLGTFQGITVNAKGLVTAAVNMSYAPLASPTFTGNPLVPNQAANDNSTKIANTAYVDAANALNLKVAGQQTTTNGFRFTSYNGGTISSGTFTPDAYNGNYQYYTNNGAHTLAAPANDCAIDILITNGASAGAITFSGFTVSSSVGDPLTTTNTNKFIISIRRINAISTYVQKALQ
jgi:hypothetical protein